MKNLLILILLFFLNQTNYAQEKQNHPNQNSIYNTAKMEVKPEFPGGQKEFYKYVKENYIVPSEAKNLKGRVYVSFVVEIDGSITNIKVLRDLGFGTGKEAIRVLKDCPKWNPGQLNGLVIRSFFSLPISIH